MNAFHLEEVLPDAAHSSIRLPRKQSGSSPQGLAVTLLADCSLRTRAWLPAAVLVALLAEAGVSAGGARTAISRLSRRGVLETRKSGRNAYYRLSLPASIALAHGGREIVSFPAEAESWDGEWTLIAFSVPQHGDTERHALRSRLRWMGYAPLYDGLWVSPYGLTAKAEVALADCFVGALTVFRAGQIELDQIASRSPVQAWDLEGIRARYDAFLHRWRPLLPRIEAAEVAGAEAVWARTEVMDAYRQFVVVEPRLPVRMMPKEWPRAEARQVFVTIYDGLAELALGHVLRAVDRFAPAGSADSDVLCEISTHSAADLESGVLLEALVDRRCSV